jgi:hypothetical protein
MLFSISTTALATVAALASTTLATPMNAAPGIERRDSATCVWFDDGDGTRYEIEITSAQNAGVCDGIGANLRCPQRRWGCSQEGDKKIMSFTTNCNSGEVERAIYLATAPHLEGVKCVTRG